LLGVVCIRRLLEEAVLEKTLSGVEQLVGFCHSDLAI